MIDPAAPAIAAADPVAHAAIVNSVSGRGGYPAPAVTGGDFATAFTVAAGDGALMIFKDRADFYVRRPTGEWMYRQSYVEPASARAAWRYIRHGLDAILKQEEARVEAAKAAREWEESGCQHISCGYDHREAARSGGMFYSPEKKIWICFGCRLALKHARWDRRRALRALLAAQK